MSSIDRRRKTVLPGARSAWLRALGVRFGGAAAALACCCTVAFAWVPPIGIPAPSFGIEQTHLMYQGQLYDYDNNGIPEAPYKDAGHGPYTHYVNRAAPNCTDGTNDANYGTPALPRCTIPGDNSNSPVPLKAGSVVEIEGDYDRDHTSPTDLHFAGTAAKPIFVRGASATNRPTITGAFALVASRYAIVENIVFADRDGDLSGGFVGGFSVADKNGQTFNSDHIALRHSDLSSNRAVCGGAGTGVYAVPVSSFTDLVFWNNVVHDSGDWQTTFDQDCHGFTVGAGASHVWVVDNQMFRNSGDGIQLNGGTGGTAFTHHIYVGRNVSHHNKQSGFWTKDAIDVVFSQNTAYGHRPSDSSPDGAGLGYQHEPDRVWFLYNTAYDNNVGIQASGTDNFTATSFYFVGNVIHDIVLVDPGAGFDPDAPYAPNGGNAFNVRGGVDRYFVNNTIYNTYGGIICYAGGATCHLENNIISKMNGGGRHLFVEGVRSASEMRNNLLYQPAGSPTILWDATLYTGLASFQAGTGKGQESLEVDPGWVNPGAADFHLQATSPATDAGLASAVYATFQSLYGLSIAVDPDGVARPQDSGWDMGAYELVANALVFRDGFESGDTAAWSQTDP